MKKKNKNENKKIIKKIIVLIIDIIYWSAILKGGIIQGYDHLMSGPQITNSVEFIITFFSAVVFWSIVTILELTIISFIYLIFFIKRIAARKHSKDKLEKIDFKNDNYYRDIISKYSPGVLSYIDDFKLEEKDIIATIMSLKLKNKIKILDDTIEITSSNKENLDENEKYILKNISNNKLKNINMEEFEEIVIKDSINSKLLETSKDVKKKLLKKVLKFVLILLILLGIFIVVFSIPSIVEFAVSNEIMNLIECIIIAILMIPLLYFPLFIIPYFKSYMSENKLNPYIRTKKGKDINTNLEGLKKYIKEYSLLDKKGYKDIIIWENYLIYSVISGQNKEIVNEIKKKIK